MFLFSEIYFSERKSIVYNNFHFELIIYLKFDTFFTLLYTALLFISRVLYFEVLIKCIFPLNIYLKWLL